MKNGDILLLMDGRILKVVDSKPSLGGLVTVQFIDREEESYLDIKKLDIENNLGQDGNAAFNFHIARSLHLRLNRLSNIKWY